MRSARLLLPLALLAGTACRRTVTVYQKVEVPVPVPCPPAPPREPLVLPIDTLPKDAPPQDQAKALKASFVALLGKVAELEALLDGYRAPKDPGRAQAPGKP